MLNLENHILLPSPLARGVRAWLVIMALLSGCATAPQPAPPPGPGATVAASGSGWWTVHIHFKWPADAKAAMHLDLLVARELFGPLIDTHREVLPLWRFHRRAARDAAGHRLGFIFYALPRTAAEINTSLMSHPLLAELHGAGIVERVVLDDPEDERRSELSATSDPAWSPAMQTSWPYFIMGASQLWLSLMDQFATTEVLGPPPGDLDALILYYKGLGDRMTATWQQEGRHALLHHLNALFGYKRLPIYLRF